MLRLGQRTFVRFASTEASTGNIKARNLIDSIVRVDHAGELGADRIYAGQVAVLGEKNMYENSSISKKSNSSDKIIKFQ